MKQRRFEEKKKSPGGVMMVEKNNNEKRRNARAIFFYFKFVYILFDDDGINISSFNEYHANNVDKTKGRQQIRIFMAKLFFV